MQQLPFPMSAMTGTEEVWIIVCHRRFTNGSRTNLPVVEMVLGLQILCFLSADTGLPAAHSLPVLTNDLFY